MTVKLDKGVFIRIILLVSALFLIGFSVWWFYSNGRLSIEMNENAKVVITNQATNQSEEFSGNGVSKMLKSGWYEILTENENGSSVSLVKIGHFMNKQIVIPVFKKGSSVSFAATGPGNCGFQDKVYVSFNCGSGTESVRYHVTGTGSSPTFSKSAKNLISLGSIGNTFVLSGKRYTVIQSNDQRVLGRNALYEIAGDSSGVGIKKVTELKSLSSDKIYFAEAYREGFLAYPETLENIFYFKMDDFENANYLEFESNDFRGLSNGKVNLDLSVVVVSANNFGDQLRSKDKTVIKVINDDKIKTFLLDEIASDVSYCAENTLCAVQDSDFVVFDISSGSLKRQYAVSEAPHFDVAESGEVYIAKKQYLINFDIKKLSGYKELDYKGFSVKSLAANSADGPELNLSDQLSTNVVRLIKSKGNTGVFRFLSELRDLGFINGVSAYEKTLYITPELGELVFSEEKGYFDYSEEAKLRVNNSIQEVLASTGIEKEGFKVLTIH